MKKIFLNVFLVIISCQSNDVEVGKKANKLKLENDSLKKMIFDSNRRIYDLESRLVFDNAKYKFLSAKKIKTKNGTEYSGEIVFMVQDTTTYLLVSSEVDENLYIKNADTIKSQDGIFKFNTKAKSEGNTLHLEFINGRTKNGYGFSKIFK